jgi:hypothetical protein
LSTWTRLLHTLPERERMIVKVICSILSNFHFHTVAPQENTEEMDEAEKTDPTQAKNMVKLSENILIQIAGVTYELPITIYHAICKQILPSLEGAIQDKSKQNPIRIPVVLAIVRLLRLLPAADLHIHLPRLLNILCNTLKDLDQVARDSARTTLVQVGN